MGPGQKFSDPGQLGSAIYGLGLKISPKTSIF